MPPDHFHVLNETRGTRVAANVVLAGTSASRRKGLLGKDAMSPESGLWITPCEAVHTFWMRFPIDVVFLNREKKVVKLVRGVKPWRIAVCLRAHSVLELESGAIDRARISHGDRLRFNSA
jgi:uncharacterized protein